MALRSNRWARMGRTLACWSVLWLTACGGGGEGGAPNPTAPGNPPPPAAPALGRLTVTVLDPARRPLREAEVRILREAFSLPKLTGIDGTTSFDAVPASALVRVNHALGNADALVTVAQQGVTSVDIVVEPHLPQPTVTLLPVEIVPGSVSADRRELSLRVALVSSRASPFIRAGLPGDQAGPYLGLSLGSNDGSSARDCSVFTSRDHPVAACASWGDPPFVVTVESFGYDEAGSVPLPTSAGTASSAMLLLDQGARISPFDARDVRRLSAKHFVDRYFAVPGSTRVLSIAGFAGNSGANVATLPATPLCMPRGTGPLFTNDASAVRSDIDVLAPFTGGSSPVFAALEAGFAAMAGGSAAGPRTVIAVIGGDDDGALSATQRAAALESLRLQRVAGGVRTILVGAIRDADVDERQRIADLAEALQAPLVSSGTIYYEPRMTTSELELYAALDLAAGLLENARLPTLSATFRVRAPTAGLFAAGSTLRGALYVQSEFCPFECAEVSLSFAAKIP